MAEDNFWNEQANLLEKALLNHPDSLLQHFLRTAPEGAIAALAGNALPTSENTRASVIATLTARLDA